MYRVRREIETTIPRSASEFCLQILSTPYAVYYRGKVDSLLYSDKIAKVLAEVDNIQFDGTF